MWSKSRKNKTVLVIYNIQLFFVLLYFISYQENLFLIIKNNYLLLTDRRESSLTYIRTKI